MDTVRFLSVQIDPKIHVANTGIQASTRKQVTICDVLSQGVDAFASCSSSSSSSSTPAPIGNCIPMPVAIRIA